MLFFFDAKKEKKKNSYRSLFFRRRYFTMGIVKLYIMYWGGFTVIIIAWVVPKVLPNITKNETIFCAKLTKTTYFA